MRIHALALICCLLLWAGCSKPKADEGEAAAATPVQTEAAKRETIHHTITAEAILYPRQQASIMPKINAPVARFLAQRGDHVKQGQLLAVLEDQDLLASAQESKQLYQQAQAGYQSTVSATMPDDLIKAKADADASRQALEAAQKVYESRLKLLQEGALSQRLVDESKLGQVQAQSQFDTAQQHLKSLQSVGQQEQVKIAQAQVDAAKAHYQGSAAQVAYAEIRSPINGVVADRGVSLGEIASSTSAIMTVIDISQVIARATVSVQEAANIQLGRPATISGAGTELKGKVAVVSPAVDPNTTTVQVWVEAANPGERLKLGTTVEVSIDAGEVPDALIVPASALLNSDDGGEKVMVAGSDSLAHERSVKVGIHSGDDVQILDGLKPGDQVITQGALGLDDKAKIEIKKPGTKDEDDK